jgi:hypothetical protein
MSQLRKMIDTLKMDGRTGGSMNSSISEDTNKASSLLKRPLTLNLNGGNTEEKKEITGYADQIASSIIEDVNDDANKKQGGDNNK